MELSNSNHADVTHLTYPNTITTGHPVLKHTTNSISKTQTNIIYQQHPTTILQIP